MVKCVTVHNQKRMSLDKIIFVNFGRSVFNINDSKSTERRVINLCHHLIFYEIQGIKKITCMMQSTLSLMHINV
jgi:hypothetical protein